MKLLRGEGRPGPLVLFTRGRRLLWFTGSGPLGGVGGEDKNGTQWLGHRLHFQVTGRYKKQKVCTRQAFYCVTAEGRRDGDDHGANCGLYAIWVNESF